jgi:hypothetical protein
MALLGPIKTLFGSWESNPQANFFHPGNEWIPDCHSNPYWGSLPLSFNPCSLFVVRLGQGSLQFSAHVSIAISIDLVCTHNKAKHDLRQYAYHNHKCNHSVQPSTVSSSDGAIIHSNHT